MPIIRLSSCSHPILLSTTSDSPSSISPLLPSTTSAASPRRLLRALATGLFTGSAFQTHTAHVTHAFTPATGSTQHSPAHLRKPTLPLPPSPTRQQPAPRAAIRVEWSPDTPCCSSLVDWRRVSRCAVDTTFHAFLRQAARCPLAVSLSIDSAPQCDPHLHRLLLDPQVRDRDIR
ncbi:hypothetical protein BU16DRAFT_561612 [Lophium mytilinum]|uniref:Uncharacterized protein n=1 Tax=Lophium mytilinum TaxID=390894 RepID=A0A6A6QT30_9PEZI|nr:hypothetical protein BU16DRAFT_561612 [Lophium mytilinum]